MSKIYFEQIGSSLWFRNIIINFHLVSKIFFNKKCKNEQSLAQENSWSKSNQPLKTGAASSGQAKSFLKFRIQLGDDQFVISVIKDCIK